MGKRVFKNWWFWGVVLFLLITIWVALEGSSELPIVEKESTQDRSAITENAGNTMPASSGQH